MISNRSTVFSALLCLMLATSVVGATEWTVYPTGQTNCTGYTDYAAKHDGEICMYGGAISGTVRKANGFAKFDIAAIPDTSTVSGIQFHYYASAANWPYWSVTPVSLDPVALGATPQLLWDDIEAEKTVGFYNYQNEGSGYAAGWHMLTLGGTAYADFTNSLAIDWFTIGVASRDSGGAYFQCIDGHNGPNVPYLVVFDTPPPPNDTCAGAVVIPGAPGTSSFSGDTAFAVNDYDCSTACVGGLSHGDADVAYAVTVPAGCELCVTLNQSVMNWNGAVYMVTDCADVNGSCVAGASGWLAGGADETFCYTAPASETYYIIVDGRTGGGAGPYQLDVQVSCLAGPTDLSCIETGGGIDLTWTNNDIYDVIEIYVDGMLNSVVPGSDTGVTVTPEVGYHCLYVCGSSDMGSQCSDDCCLVYGYDNVELLWDFEENDGGFMVEGTGAWEWGVATYGPCSGSADGKVWATDLDADYVNNACWLLDSGVIELGFGCFLAIDHCYDTENGWDGGVVWFTTDDYWYYTFGPLEGTDGVITATAGCGWVAGHDGFTGSSGGWVTDVWDFTGEMWNDEAVKFRFAFGADGSVADYSGWMIDNITVYNRDHSHPIDCDYTVTPWAGTVPFQTMHRITLFNSLVGGLAWTRRHAARIAVTIGNGTTYNPWRTGFTNIAPGSYYVTTFPLTMPALGSVIGTNSFKLMTRDVTPAPYNQPPNPPAGSTCTRTNVVTANAP